MKIITGENEPKCIDTFYTINALIEELEKIKAELTDLKLDLCDYPKSVVFKVLDNHIAELKGENND